MRVVVFDTHAFDRAAFGRANEHLGHELTFLEPRLDRTTAALEKLEPGVNYYWRVLTRTDGGWVPSAVARVEAPTCPVDSVVERDKD